MPYPRMMKLHQHFVAPRVKDVAGTVREELKGLDISDKIKAGDRVAITVGSRGVANIALIVKTVVEYLKGLGASPFIVPAMGSHGGGTAEGQRAIVEGYGVTEDYVGAPIKASMETVQVDTIDDGVPVMFDKYAYEADHVAVVARVKPHTDLIGPIESGLHKMMLIGLGKHAGARIYHKAFVKYSFEHVIQAVGRSVIDKCNILLGLAVVENQYDDTALIKAVAPRDFYQEEVELLQTAKKLLPRLPFLKVDLLIVDEIGKEISGDGMDTNVVGRKYGDPFFTEDNFPQVTRIYVRDLTDKTKGNATGLGLADFTHARVVEKMDRRITYVNCLTGGEARYASIPPYFDSDREVLDAALQTIGFVEPEDARIVRIRHTLDVQEVLVSEVYRPELAERSDLDVLEPPRPMTFDPDGNWLPF